MATEEEESGIGKFLGGLLGPLVGGAAIAGGSALTKSAYDRLGDIGEQAVLGTTVDGQTIPGALAMAQSALDLSQFRPFTVTSATGGTFGVTPTIGAEGQVTGLGTTMGLSPAEAALQSQLLGTAATRLSSAGPLGAEQLAGAGQQLLGAGQQQFGQVPAMSPAILGASQNLMGMGQAQLGAMPFGLSQQEAAAQQAFGLGGQFMGQAGMPMGAREQAVYDRIRATQLGEEERQRLALEERLFAQGRGGVQTSMFGGTPEQLALAKAQESAQNQAALMAMQQAQAEQQQQAALGAQFVGLGSGLAGQRQALEAAQQAQALQALTSGTAFAGQEEALRSAQQVRALQALTGGMGLLTGGMGLQQAQQQLGLGALGGAYVPQAQLLNAIQATQLFPQLQQQAQLFGAGQYGETMMSGLEARLIAEQARANLLGGIGSGVLGGMFSPVQTDGGIGSLFGSLLGDIFG